MPRYFFHVHSAAPSIDEQGHELLDDEAAWQQAVRYAGDLLRDTDRKFRPGQQWSIEVSDEAQKPLYFISVGSRRMK